MMSGRTLSGIWAAGIAAGSSVYLIFDSFGIGKHPIGDGIWVGAMTVVALFSLGLLGDK